MKWRIIWMDNVLAVKDTEAEALAEKERFEAIALAEKRMRGGYNHHVYPIVVLPDEPPVENRGGL